MLVALTVTTTITPATTATALLAILLAIGALAGVRGAIGMRGAGYTTRLAFRTRATLSAFRAGATATTAVVGAWATVLTRTALAFVTRRLRGGRACVHRASGGFRAACLSGWSVFAARTVAARGATATAIAAAAAATITAATRAARATTATGTAAATAGVFTFRRATRCDDGHNEFRFDALDFDLEADVGLDLREHGHIVFAAEADGIAFRAGTRGAANAVDVVFRVVRQVLVEHVADIGDVQAARSDVRGDENGQRAIVERTEHLQTLVLRYVTAHRFGVEAVRL